MTSPGTQRPATVIASRLAMVTSADRQAAAASAMAITSSSKRRDGSRTASAAKACTGERVGMTRTFTPSPKASSAAVCATARRLVSVGSTATRPGPGGEDRVEDVRC